jgi:hypothetical protein
MNHGSRVSLHIILMLCAAVAALLLAGCSRNETKPSGPAPSPPQNARVATPIPKEGSGMNQMVQPQQPEDATGATKAIGGADNSFDGDVSLAPSLSGGFPKGATLFVIARDPNDRTVPLAVVKLKPEAFPVRFTITSADSMTGAKLPGEVELLCKLSKSGAVSASSSGDLEAAPVRAKSGTPAVLVLEKK